MARVVTAKRAAGLIVSDCRETLYNAACAGEDLYEDAKSHLAEGVKNARSLSRQIEDLDDDVAMARARVKREGLTCVSVAQDIKDLAFNKTGRRANDPRLAQIMPEAISRLGSLGGARKVRFVERIALGLEKMKHPRIPAALAREWANRLRDSLQGLREALEALAPLVEEKTSLTGEYTLNARHLQLQVRNLKKHWLSLEYSPQEVHELIPDTRPNAKPKGDAADELDDGEADDEGSTDAGSKDEGSDDAAAKSDAPEDGEVPPKTESSEGSST